jgi:hypothetical protein
MKKCAFIWLSEIQSIRNWLEERVFLPDRQNADEISSKLGLTEYDLVSILKRTQAKNC